jgi:hypothetical protein
MSVVCIHNACSHTRILTLCTGHFIPTKARWRRFFANFFRNPIGEIGLASTPTQFEDVLAISPPYPKHPATIRWNSQSLPPLFDEDVSDNESADSHASNVDETKTPSVLSESEDIYEAPTICSRDLMSESAYLLSQLGQNTSSLSKYFSGCVTKPLEMQVENFCRPLNV